MNREQIAMQAAQEAACKLALAAEEYADHLSETLRGWPPPTSQTEATDRYRVTIAIEDLKIAQAALDHARQKARLTELDRLKAGQDQAIEQESRQTPTRWQDLLVDDADGPTGETLGTMIDGAAANLDNVVWDEDGSISEWQGYYIHAEGEEASDRSPAGTVDWAGLREALGYEDGEAGQP